jgi:selenocysteine-specific elongation factor
VGTRRLDGSLILGTAGHIDHGKTALVKALTGVDADRLPEEKRRGITIDLGFAPLELAGSGTIGIVDVPGHEAFIRTMLAGASGIDLAMLVVAADEGVMPQTREHLEILTLLKIPRGVIALTKCDLADAEWRALVIDELRILCAGTPLADAEIVEVSAVTGQNIEELKSAIGRAASLQAAEESGDLFRMPVDRAFTVKGTGTVITGTVWSGRVDVDSVVRIEPAGKQARIRAIQSHGASLRSAGPRNRTALALAGCDVADVPRGSTIVQQSDWVPSLEIDVEVTLTDPDFAPTPRTRVRVHLGTAETGARMSRLRSAADNRLYSRLVLDEPIMSRGGDRFVIRIPSPSRTVGGGEVLDPYPLRKGAASGRAKFRSTASAASSRQERLADMLDRAGVSGLKMSSIPVRIGLPPGESRPALERLGAIIIGELAVDSRAMEKLENTLESIAAIHVANHPLEAGVSLQTLRAGAKAPSAIVEVALSRLHARGRIELSGSVARPAGWTSRLDSHEQELSDAILHDICTHSAEPPSVAELERKFGGSTPALLRRLERQGDVERVAEDRYYSRESVESMVDALRSGLIPGRRYSPAELKEVLGVTRKYLIPFLEYCDRKGVTERHGDGRQVRAVEVEAGMNAQGPSGLA